MTPPLMTGALGGKESPTRREAHTDLRQQYRDGSIGKSPDLGLLDVENRAVGGHPPIESIGGTVQK